MKAGCQYKPRKPSLTLITASFTYDGDGKRVKSVITTNLGTTTTYFVGNYYLFGKGL
jgi:hypothetical protein